MILAKTMTKPTHEPPYARTQRCGQAVAEEARAAIATTNEATRRLRAIMRSSSRASSSTPCTHQRLAHLLAMASLRDDCVAVAPAKGRDYSRPALAHRATSRFPSPPHPRRTHTAAGLTHAHDRTHGACHARAAPRTRTSMRLRARYARVARRGASSCTRPGQGERAYARMIYEYSYVFIQLYNMRHHGRVRGESDSSQWRGIAVPPWLSLACVHCTCPGGIRKAGHSAMEQRSYTSVTLSGVVYNVSVLCRATRVHSVSMSSGEHAVNRSSTANLTE